MVSGKGYSGINEEIIWISIGMGITIAILITIALCYIAREKCRKRHEGYYTSWRMFPPPSWASWSFSPTTPGILFSPTTSRGKPRAYYITVWILAYTLLQRKSLWKSYESRRIWRTENVCKVCYININAIWKQGHENLRLYLLSKKKSIKKRR